MVTSYQHPTMLKHKVMDKEEVDKIKELKAKEREERRLKMVEGTFTQAKWASQTRIEKENKTTFNNAWSILLLRLLMKDSTTI